MTYIYYKSLFERIPKSDETLATEIGVSSKTIKRLRTGTYLPSRIVHHKIESYVRKLLFKLAPYAPDDTRITYLTKDGIKHTSIES